MHSHKTFALLALAASTASPALSAPVLEGRASAAAAGGGIGSILKTIGTGLGFGALPVVLQDVLGGNSTRRDTPHIIVDGLPVGINPRGIGSAFTSLLDSISTSGSIGKVIGEGLLGGVATGAGAIGAGELLNHTRREPSPFELPNLSGIGKTILGAGASLATADVIQTLFGPNSNSTSRRDLKEALQLLSRQLNELD
ncbi:hypothetical protein EDB86DRAFT_2832419 [Lactarius hatsudake]|nr:hypothetical protein EDB86DRAFT_2832419 [Lactarius hatsudake]